MEGLDANLIDGKLVPAASGATFATVNPATEEVLGLAADGGAADLDRAVDADGPGLRAARVQDHGAARKHGGSDRASHPLRAVVGQRIA